MKNEDNDKTLQKALCKLISEEWYATNLYNMMKLACNTNEKPIIFDVFSGIAIDEMNDHLVELVKWCETYGYEIPCTEADFKKFANKDCVKLVEKLKKNENALYYIETAIKSEELAISSYKEVLALDMICNYTDLQALLWHIYYDEVEHGEKLHTTHIAYDANVNMLI